MNFSSQVMVALLLLALALAFLLLSTWKPLRITNNTTTRITTTTTTTTTTTKNKNKNQSKKRRYHPVAGTIFHHLLNFHRLHDFSTSQARRHTTYRLLAPFRHEVYTSDPANVEYILHTNFSNYGKGEYNSSTMKDLLGDGIFAVDGQKWKQQRKVASFEFSRRILRDYSCLAFQSNAAKLASLISNNARSEKIFDIQDLFMKSTMDSIFQLAFGVELNCLSGSSEEGNRFAKAFDDSSTLIVWRYVDISWKLKKFLNIGCEAILRKKLEVVDDFVYKMILSKIGSMSKQHDSMDARSKGDILSRFLIEREKDPENINHKYLRDIILNFIVAGRDTTAVTLSWFFYILCKHPSIEERVVQEVEVTTKEFEVCTSIDEFTARLTEEIINKMQYLHAALSETLRMYPAVPIDPKVCFSDDTLPDGYDVRKGDMVAYMPYAMGRLKSIWGDDAEIFRPERWINNDGNFSHESPFKFTAFQAGPRICLGKEFAYSQMKIFAAVLLHFFRFRLRDEKKPVNYRTMLTLQIDNGLHLQASHR